MAPPSLPLVSFVFKYGDESRSIRSDFEFSFFAFGFPCSLGFPQAPLDVDSVVTQAAKGKKLFLPFPCLWGFILHLCPCVQPVFEV